jgi:ankyrin repeat protein
MNLKSIVSLCFGLFFSTAIFAQENVFLSRAYWKTNPSVTQIKESIKAGNDPAALNGNAFDGVVYALLEQVNAAAIEFLLTQKGNEIEKRTHDSRTYIFWAAYKGNVDIMKHLLAKGAKLDVRDSHGNTPATFAASTGQKNTEVYDLFEKHGARLSQEKTEDGVQLLFLVTPYLESAKELTYFVDKGFNLTETDPKGNNIFNYAAKKGDIDFLNLLIEKGVDPKVVNKEGGNAILYASQGMRNSKNTLATYQFLENLGIAAHVIGDRGRNPLHSIAYSNENLDIFKYFIDKGVDVNLQDNGGNSPFMNAANSNSLAAVQFLSTYVKDINSKDENGRSALAMAINRNTPEVVDFLLKKGADVQTKDKDGNSLAYYVLNTFKAKDTAAFETKLRLLQDKGVRLAQTQNTGNSLLHIAVERNNLALVKRLAAFNLDIDAKNSDGYTALHIAAMKAADVGILKYLLAQGADKTIKTDFDETALNLAQENELLQKQNVQLNFLR